MITVKIVQSSNVIGQMELNDVQAFYYGLDTHEEFAYDINKGDFVGIQKVNTTNKYKWLTGVEAQTNHFLKVSAAKPGPRRRKKRRII